MNNYPRVLFFYPLLLILSAQLGAGGHGVVDQHQVYLLLAVLLVNGGDQHAAAGDAHHLPGRQVQDGDGGLADELLRLVELVDAGDDGAVGAAAVVQRELQQLVGFLHRLAVLDLHRAEVGLAECVEVHVLLGVGLQLDGGQGGLLLRLLHGVQLGQRLIRVDAGEQVLALADDRLGGQHAPYVGAVPAAALVVRAQLGEDLIATVGHDGLQKCGADADSLQQVVQHGGQTVALALVLAQCPGRRLVDILVGTVDDLEHLVQTVLQLELVHLRLIAVAQGAGHLLQLAVLGGVLPAGGQLAAEVLLHHAGGAADQIAQLVGQVGVDGADQQLVGEVAVGAEGEGAQQEEAQRVHAEHFGQGVGIHHVALGFAHLAAVNDQPAVAVDVLGQRHAHAHEHGRPDDGVEADDLLAHDVVIGRPVLVVVVISVVVKAQRGAVVEQSVHPHIHHMAGVEVHGNAPAEAGAADAQILQTGLDEVVDHLVDAGAGLQEVGVLQQMLYPVGVLAQAEEIGLLLGVLDLAAAVGALAVHQLALRPEALAGGAVLALIGALVDVTLLVHGLEDLLHGGAVVVVGGTDKPVVGDVHQLPQVEDAPLALHDVIHELLGGHAGFFGLRFDLLAVLVGAGEEHHVIALQALVAGDGVGGHSAVAVADVQLVRGVVDRRGDIKRLLFHAYFSFSPFRMEERYKITHTILAHPV